MPKKIGDVEYWSKSDIRAMLGGDRPMDRSTLNSRLKLIGMQCATQVNNANYYTAEQVEVLRQLDAYMAKNGGVSVGFSYGGYSVSDRNQDSAIQLVEQNSAILDDSDVESRASRYPGEQKAEQAVFSRDLASQMAFDKNLTLNIGETRAARVSLGSEVVFRHCLETGIYSNPELQAVVDNEKNKSRSLLNQIVQQSPNDFAQALLEELQSLGA